MDGRCHDEICEIPELLIAKGTLTAQLAVLERYDESMAAIEQGIITESTKSRLLELEDQQSALEEQLEFEKSKIMDVSREQVLAWLKTFQQYDIDDPKVRANLFKTFISAIYLYDDHFRIVFNYSGDNSEIDLPLIDAIGQSNNPAGCSFSLSKGVPWNKNREPTGSRFSSAYL